MRRKKISALCLCAVLLLQLFALPAVQAAPSQGEKKLTVDGIDAFVSPQGQGWQFDSMTNTLTLNNYQGGAICAEGFDLKVVLAEGSVNTITSDVSQNASALGAGTFGYSDNHLTIQGQGQGQQPVLKINGDLQGIFAQGDVTIQNCDVTVEILSTEESEQKVSDGTRSNLIFACIRSGGGLLLENSTFHLSSKKSRENNKQTYVGIGAITGEAKISGCNLTIHAANTGIQSSNRPLTMERCVLDVCGNGTAAIVCQYEKIAMTGCSGKLVSDGAQGIGITAQRKGLITLADCSLSLQTTFYGVMALAGDLSIQGTTLDFPKSTSYGLYAGGKAELTNRSTVNGSNCTFVCYMPSASGCTVDGTSSVNGLQIYNGKQNIAALGTFTLSSDRAKTLGENVAGRAFAVAPNADVTIEQGADLDLTKAVSVRVEGKLTNFGTLRLTGAATENTGTIVNWGGVKGTFDAAVNNSGEIYSVCTALFPVQGNAMIPMHSALPAVKENIIPPTCTSGGSHDNVVYCGACGTELSREGKELEAAGHVPDAQRTYNETTCWLECTVCGEKIEEAPHTFRQITETALQWEECSACGYQREAAPGTGGTGRVWLWTMLLLSGGTAACCSRKKKKA